MALRPTGLRFRAALALAGAALALLAVLFEALGPAARVQWAAYHALFALRGPRPFTAPVLLLALDEPSLAALGVWPVPRRVWAELTEGLLGAGAAVVAFDVAFVQAQGPAEDGAFARALARHPGRVVLAGNRQAIEGSKGEGEQLILPLPELARHARIGMADLPLDPGGAIHQAPMWHVGPDAEGELGATRAYPGLALATAMAMGRSQVRFANALEAPPLLIDFAGPASELPTVPVISALEGLRHRDPKVASLVRGKAVMIGATARRLQDQYPTPFAASGFSEGSELTPGVAIHAQALGGFLEGRGLQPVPLAWRALFLLGLGLGAAWLWGLAPAASALLATLSLALLLGGLSLWAFRQGWWWDPAQPMGLLLAMGGLGTAARWGRAELARRAIRRTFERYVAKPVVEAILKDPSSAPRLGGEQRTVTALFSDIRGFTTLSEGRSPEAVVEILNAYLTAMARVIHAEGGCIDKFVGDAIMAVWGNVQPLSPEEGARAAVRAGLGMLAEVRRLGPLWEAQGHPRIAIGVGVNTGLAVVGNLGSPERMEFAVIGDAINVASRCESITKEVGADLVVSAETWALLGPGFEGAYLGERALKGRAQSVGLYRVDAFTPPPAGPPRAPGLG